MKNLNQVLEKITLIGIFLVPIVPFVVTNSLFFPYITGKNFLFRILVEIVFAAWLIWLLNDDNVRPKKSGLFYSVLVLALIMIVSAMFGEVPDKSFWSNFERMEGVIGYLHVFALSVVLMSVMTKERFQNYFHTIIGVAVTVAGYGFMQSLGVFRISLDGVRVDSTLGNPIYMAVYTLLAGFLSIFYLLNKDKQPKHAIMSLFIGLDLLAVYLVYQASKSNIDLTTAVTTVVSVIVLINIFYFVLKKWIIDHGIVIANTLYAIFFIFFTYLIYLTQTRGAIVGFLAGLLLMLVILSYKEENQRVKKIARILLVSVVLLSVGFFFGRDSAFIQSNPTLSRIANISLNDTTTASRLMIWRLGLEGFKEHPVLGWGNENFNLVFNKYYDSDLYRNEEWFDRSHNIFVDWLIHTGLLGFLAYLALYWFAFYYLWKSDKELVSMNQKVTLTALLVAYIVQNVFVFDNISGIFIFVSVIAYIHVLTNNEEKKSGIELKNKMFAGSTLFVLFLIAMYFFNVKPIIAANLLNEATVNYSRGEYQNALDKYTKILEQGSGMAVRETREQMMLAGQKAFFDDRVPIGLKQKYLEEVTKQMNAQIEVYDKDARNYVLLGSFLKTYRNFDQALYNLRIAKELSPEKTTPYFMACEIYIAKNDLDSALREAQLAYNLNEQNEESVRILSLVHYLRGENKIADDLLVKRFGTVNTYDDRLLRAYQILGMNQRILDVWLKFVDDHPEDRSGYLKLVEIYSGIGEKELASKAYLKVVDLAKADVEENPEDISKLIKLFEYYVRGGDSENALMTINKALELTLEKIDKKPKDYINYISAASYYMVLGQGESAIQILQKALKIEEAPRGEINGYIKIIAEGGNPWSGK